MVDEDWESRASKILKAEMLFSDVDYAELIKRLAALGFDESYGGIANKINRGKFTFAFFIRCMKALGKSTIRIDYD